MQMIYNVGSIYMYTVHLYLPRKWKQIKITKQHTTQTKLNSAVA